MESYGKPKSGYGKRNLFCRKYGECLDQAIRQSWMSFRCTGCDYNHTGSCNDDRYIPTDAVTEYPTHFAFSE